MLNMSAFTPPQLDEIHGASLQVLDEIGVLVKNDRAVELFRRNGYRVEGQRVHFPREEIERTVKEVEPRLDLWSRDGMRCLELEGRRSYFGPGGGAPNLFGADIARRPSTKADVARVTRVCDALPNMDFIMSDVTAQDAPPATQDMHELEAMVLNTGKPVVAVGLSGHALVDMAYQVTCLVRGRAAVERPFVLLYFQPTSPLQLDTEPVNRLLRAMELGMPLIISGASSAGGTVPVTIPGAIVTANAENLAAMTLARLVRPRPPLVYGIGGTALDLVTGNFCYGAPELCFLSGLAVGDLGAHYGFPTWGRGACSDAKAVDAQFGSEVFMTAVFAAAAGVNLIHDTGRVDFGRSGCPEALVVADEIVDAARRVLRGVVLDREQLALDAIREIGPGGTFLKSRHTLRHYRREQWRPALFSRLDYSAWATSPEREVATRAKARLEKLLVEHMPPALDPALVEEIGRIRAVCERDEIAYQERVASARRG